MSSRRPARLGSRRLSVDLTGSDIRDPETLTRIVASHVVTPARAMFGLPAASPDEQAGIIPAFTMGMDGRLMWPREAPARSTFEPFLRGYALLTALIPGAIEAPVDARAFLAVPGASLIRHAFSVAVLGYTHLDQLIRGVLGEPVGRPDNPFILRHYLPTANDAALDELAAAAALVRAALGTPDDPSEIYTRQDIGLTAITREVAFSIDEVLRRDVHWRLVWFGDVELAIDPDGEADEDDDAPLLPIIVDRGVIDALVPETITGLVVLDLVESLRLGQRQAPCAVCQQMVVLDARRAGRARRGEPVYHADCHEAFRLRFVRDYQRERRRKARVNSTSAVSVSTDAS